MQKDIRKYDMKEVEFQQDREDRRFLILEVSKYFFRCQVLLVGNLSCDLFRNLLRHELTQKNSQCNIP